MQVLGFCLGEMALRNVMAWVRTTFMGLLERPYLRTVMSNVGWLMFDRALRALIGVFVGAWVARYLGPEGYGELAYAVAMLAMFQAVSNLSLDGILVREVSQSADRASSLVGTVFYLRLIVGFLAWFGVCALVVFVRPFDERSQVMVALLGAGLMFQSVDVIDLWFQSQMRNRLSVFAKAFGYCSAAAIKIALILVQAPLWTFALALLLDTVLAGLALVFAYRKFPVGLPWKWDSVLAVRLLKEAAPFLLASLAVSGYMRIDQLILRHLAGEEALGLYSAALPFSQVWHTLPVAMLATLMPRMASLRMQEPLAYERRLQQILSMFMLAGIVAAALLALISDWVVSLLLGDGFAGAGLVLQVHGLSNVFVFLTIGRHIATVVERKSTIGLWKAVSGLVVCVLCNLWLVPLYGALGAAFSAVLSYFFSCLLVEYFLDRKIFYMQLNAVFIVRHFKKTVR